MDFGIDHLIQDKTKYEKQLKSVEEYSDKISSLEFKIKMRLKDAKSKLEITFWLIHVMIKKLIVNR